MFYFTCRDQQCKGFGDSVSRCQPRCHKVSPWWGCKVFSTVPGKVFPPCIFTVLLPPGVYIPWQWGRIRRFHRSNTVWVEYLKSENRNNLEGWGSRGADTVRAFGHHRGNTLPHRASKCRGHRDNTMLHSATPRGGHIAARAGTAANTASCAIKQ